jgi:hypothetical protein
MRLWGVLLCPDSISKILKWPKQVSRGLIEPLLPCYAEARARTIIFEVMESTVLPS